MGVGGGDREGTQCGRLKNGTQQISMAQSLKPVGKLHSKVIADVIVHVLEMGS